MYTTRCEYFGCLSLSKLIAEIEIHDLALRAHVNSRRPESAKEIEKEVIALAREEYKKRTGDMYVVKRERPAEPK
ncbi:hypothetical protein AUJ84_01180 [Candidatus Pacearchaeota archaeon CG1_02_32_132]|nr:MAG: hypothetical protein AUJ84_01180 [Candidatus Pacearchaeota archaeon CG1_02_32_132]